MMNYLLDKNTVFKNQNRPRRSNKIMITLVLIVGLYIMGPLIYRGLSGVAVIVVRPVFVASEKSQGLLFRTVNFFRTQRSLVLQVENLKKTVEIQSEQLRANKLQLAELAVLQKVASRYENKEAPVVARVFDRPPRTMYDTFLVDIGRNQSDSIRLGDKVVVQENLLLGEVVQIFSNTTKIKFYSSPRTDMNVVIGPNSVPAVVSGAGNGNFTTKLPRGLKIEKGDQVIVQNPESYLIGLVGGVDNDPRNPLQTIYIASPINIYELSWIEIIH
ncbi:MAG: hypothetical protein K8Q91_02310 [Candidatus Vogelbacteria bacterium]|nr:hypothetical protein [Candidatus Vogelbacteria bacterium]